MEPIFTVSCTADRKRLLESIWKRTGWFVLLQELFLLGALGYSISLCSRAIRLNAQISPAYYVILLGCVLFLMFWTVFRNFHMVNRQIKQYKAAYGQPFAKLEYRFFEDSFEEQNLLSGGCLTLFYSSLSRMRRSKNMILLQYRYAVLLLPYDGIHGGSPEELEAFLKHKRSEKA